MSPNSCAGRDPVLQGWARTQKNEEALVSDTFVGVDVAKAEVVVACRPDGVRWTAANDGQGIAATVARLRTIAPTLVVKSPFRTWYTRTASLRAVAVTAWGFPVRTARRR
jgi:ABC-type Fe2+-enterobactin transport system substrate-binding protein